MAEHDIFALMVLIENEPNLNWNEEWLKIRIVALMILIENKPNLSWLKIIAFPC